jgi:hypothetical protein
LPDSSASVAVRLRSQSEGVVELFKPDPAQGNQAQRKCSHCSDAKRGTRRQDSTRQASCSSTSTRRCRGTRQPRSRSGSDVAPAAANSPARTLSFRISPSIGAATRLRAISVSLALAAASAWATRARSVRAPKRRRSSSSRLMTFCRESVSARLSWFWRI